MEQYVIRKISTIEMSNVPFLSYLNDFKIKKN